MPHLTWSTETTHRKSCALIDAMNVEWARLRTSSAAEAAVARWRRIEPTFTDVRDLDDVMACAERRGQNDPAIAALLRQAQAGDEFAARTVLQVMLGATVALAMRTVHLVHQDLDEAVSRAVTTLWGLIRSYPIERRTGHVNNLSLDILGSLTRRGATQREAKQTSSWDELVAADESADLHLQRSLSHGLQAGGEVWTHPSLLDGPGAGQRVGEQRAEFWDAAAIDTHRRADDEQLLLLLAWATRTGVISRRDAQLLVALHSPAEPGRTPTAVDVARSLQVTPAAVRQRSSRAIRQLRTAVQSYAALPIESRREAADSPKPHAELPTPRRQPIAA